MMIQKIPIAIIIPLIFYALNDHVVSSSNIDSYLSVIEKPCMRQCDSHFTGAECWSKTYNYYTNHLFQSVVQYKNALHNTKLDTIDVFNKTFVDFKVKEDGIAKLINDFFKQDIDKFFIETANMLQKAEYSENRIPKLEIKCPIKCNYESLSVWISLFGVFIGLTIASVIFVVAFVLFSKLEIHKIGKKNAAVAVTASNGTANRSLIYEVK